MKMLISLAPIGILALAVAFVVWERKRRGMRAPVSEKMLRPPGESLRIKTDKLNDKLTDSLVAVLMATGGFAFLMDRFGDSGNEVVSLVESALLGLPLIAFAWFAIRVCRVAILLRNYRLGFAGERLVGEELNRLMADGCRVFHDFPADSTWNIDHIVVAPTGVFTIETKTRSKGGSSDGQKGHKVTFDGSALYFSHNKDSSGIEQARRNAEWLARFLSSATAEPVKTVPILTFPGWWVDRKGKGAVHVLNPKEIRTCVLGKHGADLSKEQITRIAHQLDQKCRDVEF